LGFTGRERNRRDPAQSLHQPRFYNLPPLCADPAVIGSYQTVLSIQSPLPTSLRGHPHLRLLDARLHWVEPRQQRFYGHETR
jgi:hypothetical protein